MYFHVVYGGARRRYGGAGRNSPKNNAILLVVWVGPGYLRIGWRQLLPAPYYWT